MDQVKQLFEKSNVPAAKLWGANFKSGEEWKLSFNYSENDDDIFRIASMTKLLTTIGSLQLVEKGKLEMDQPLNDFLLGLADVSVIDELPPGRKSIKTVHRFDSSRLKVFQFIEGALAPILNGINWLLGGVGKIMDFLSQASALAKKILNWIGCTGIKCETPSKWVSKVNKKIMGKVDDWGKQIDNIGFLDGVEKDLQEFEKKVGSTKLMKWLNGEDTEEAKETYVNGVQILDLLNTVKKITGGKVDPTNVLGSLDGAIGTLSLFGNGHDALSACSDSIWNPKTQYDLIEIPIVYTHTTCIPPVTEVNGTGSGAVTKPIVGDDGSIFSIEVIHAGSGYDHTTSIAVIDRSNFGAGAQAKPIIENGSLKEVVLLYPGSGYCGGNDDGLDGYDTTLIDTDTSGGGIGTSVVGIVTNFYVYTTGIGYTDGDTVGIGTTTVSIRTTPNGSIVEVDPTTVSGMGFSKRPRLSINSTTGFGAELIPIMKYNIQRTCLLYTSPSPRDS